MVCRPSHRDQATSITGAFVPFLYADVGATNLGRLGSDGNASSRRTIAYLRGGSTFGAGPTAKIIEGIDIGQFRQRTSKLGNISDSKPVIVGPPIAEFTDCNDFGYEAFKATPSDARPCASTSAPTTACSTCSTAATTRPPGGTEVFAYIPERRHQQLDRRRRQAKGIRALTFQDGGSPIFKHHFYVNASPKTMDVDFANCGARHRARRTGGPSWSAASGKGGNTYFAIDATDPTTSPPKPTQRARSCGSGQLPASEFSFGKPIIAKTRADGWVVIIASGYNNTDDGKGHLYFLKASDGTFIRKLDTTAADDGTRGQSQRPRADQRLHQGLAQPDHRADLRRRPQRRRLAVGRLRMPTRPPGKPDQALCRAHATASEARNRSRPKPQIEIDLNNGVDRFVFIGTGRLLDPSDLDRSLPRSRSRRCMRSATAR